MMVKLLLSWDIREGQDEAYFTFIVKAFVPTLMRLGLRPTDAWYTIYGDEPKILIGAVAEDLDIMTRALQSETWAQTREKLARYIENYRQKIIPARSTFQL